MVSSFCFFFSVPFAIHFSLEQAFVGIGILSAGFWGSAFNSYI